MNGRTDPPEHPTPGLRRTRRSTSADAFSFADVRLRRDFEEYISRLEEANPEYVIGWDAGREYARIWKMLRGQRSRSVVAFVDRYANVYRAESWKARGRMLAPAAEMMQTERDRANRSRAKPTRGEHRRRRRGARI